MIEVAHPVVVLLGLAAEGQSACLDWHDLNADWRDLQVELRRRGNMSAGQVEAFGGKVMQIVVNGEAREVVLPRCIEAR